MTTSENEIRLEILASLSSLYQLQPFEQEAIESIIDQLTVKPTTQQEEGYGDRAEYINYCPTCGEDLRYYEISYDSNNSGDRCFKYCPFCGQRIEES